ncbi:MAG: hypothetical protein HY863_15695 [Chloroflexi bacterium]|nr:hypothetical protein [Chloroflexota bacterium]
MNSSKTASFKVTLRASQHVVDDAQYAVCLHDFERHGVSRPTLNGDARKVHGLPETVSVLDRNGFIFLTKPIQMQWHKWCCAAVPSMSAADQVKSFVSLTASDRAWNNRYGSDLYACYPAGTNLDKEVMRLFPLLGGGTVIKILNDPNSQILEYETMSSTEDISIYSPATHPHLFFQPPNSIRVEIWWMKKDHSVIVPTPPDINKPAPGTEWSGKWDEHRVDPFPQFANQSIVPIMTRGAKFNRIDRVKVRLLPKGAAFPSPFVE